MLLGDTTLTNMTVPLSAGVFDGTDRYLRVWFSENNIAYELLSPDRRIAAVPYALQAQEAAYAAYAADAGMLDGQQAGSFQTRVSGFCPVGSTVRAINPDGTVVCQAGALSRAVAPTGNVSATLAVASEYGPFPSLTIGTDGLGLISYCTSSGNLAVRHCDDLACTSTTGASLGVDCDYDYPPPSVTIGVTGNPQISVGQYLVLCDNPACTSHSVQNIPSGGQSSITIGADGRALISSADGGYLKVIHCDDRYCGSTTVTDLDSASGGDTSVTIGVDGLGLISYYRSGDLGVAHCDDLLCTSATLSWNNLAVDIGQYNSVTIGADGLPLISFYDAIDGNLMVAHCNDVACTSATTWATLDGTPVDDVGAYNSVTIGADGLGLISYYDTANGDLKVAHCRDLDCTAADITTLDSDGDVGGETSVTIGTDGLPLIGYWDNAPPYHLKVFHCGSPSCTPYFRRR